MKLNIRRTSRYYYLRFIRLQDSPSSLAIGSALGAAIAVTPTLPLHTLCIIGLTLLLRVNTLAALMAGTIISNPLTFAGQYYLSWKIGSILLPGRLDWEQLHGVLVLVRQSSFLEGITIMGQLGFDAMLVLQTGGLVLAIPLGIITYLITIRFFIRLQEKKQQKHLLNK
ncbi:DUF2062 domain-containing protein [Desulfobulbus sp. US2]|nr:DUF2062 domain-containing protein [Desulfobulbus sp. US4]MCW5207102.1 DUF2062 domain-containing protein [Desulfobulbus sp. US2]MCW5213790.1 DUF2062 domain-containing protein [Desulfobulbus sp. US5]WLE95938.1 MAG: DUF2062 domain-containing protein [Candidatus Electrothrix communis]